MVALFVDTNTALTPEQQQEKHRASSSERTKDDDDDNDDGRTIYHHRLQNARNTKAKVITSPKTTNQGSTTSSFSSSILPGNRNTFNTSSIIDIVASTLFIERGKQRNDENIAASNTTTNSVIQTSTEITTTKKEPTVGHHTRKDKQKLQKQHEKQDRSGNRKSSIISNQGILRNQQKQQQLLKPKHQSRKADKKVQFAMNIDTFTVHIIPRYNSSESIDIWYGPMEYRHMEMQRKRTIAYLQNSYIYRYNINFNTFCYQGLEKHFTSNQLSYIKDQEIDFQCKYEGMGTVPLSRDGRSRSSQRSYELTPEEKLSLLSELIATERHRQQQRRTHQQKNQEQQHKVYRSTDLITKQNSRPFQGDHPGQDSDKYTKYKPLDLNPSGSASPSRRSKSMSSPTKTIRIDKLLSLSTKNRTPSRSGTPTSRTSSPRKTKSISTNTFTEGEKKKNDTVSTGTKTKKIIHSGIAVKTNSSDSDDPLSIAPPFTGSSSLSPQKHRPNASSSSRTNSPTKKKLSLSRSGTPPSPSMLSRIGSKTLAPTTSYNKYDVKNDSSSTSRPVLKANDSKYVDYYNSRKQHFLTSKR